MSKVITTEWAKDQGARRTQVPYQVYEAHFNPAKAQSVAADTDSLIIVYHLSVPRYVPVIMPFTRFDVILFLIVEAPSTV